jgi:hypothetical protein
MPSSSASASAIRERAEPMERAKSFIRPQATSFREPRAMYVLDVAAAKIKTRGGGRKSGLDGGGRRGLKTGLWSV